MTDPTFDPAALKALLARAHDEIANIAEGKRRWTMSIPAKLETDSDLLISSALSGAEKALAALAAAREELADARLQIEKLTTALDIVALREIRQAADLAIAQRDTERLRESVQRGRQEIYALKAAVPAAEPLVAGLIALPELRHSDPGDGPCPHPFCVAKAAPLADGPGHCGLCGSEDCPGKPGEGCTPGPFEPYVPGDGEQAAEASAPLRSWSCTNGRCRSCGVSWCPCSCHDVTHAVQPTAPSPGVDTTGGAV